MKRKQLKTFRLYPHDLRELKEVSLALGLNQTAVLERALQKLFWEIKVNNQQ